MGLFDLLYPSKVPEGDKAFKSGFERGFTFNTGPKIRAAGQAGLESVANSFRSLYDESKKDSFRTLYEKYNRANYEAQAKLERENPTNFLLGEIGGSAVVPLPFPKIGMLKKMLAGGLYGAASGLTSGEKFESSEPFKASDASDYFSDAGYGAAAGSTVPPALWAAGKGANVLGGLSKYIGLTDLAKEGVQKVGELLPSEIRESVRKLLNKPVPVSELRRDKTKNIRNMREARDRLELAEKYDIPVYESQITKDPRKIAADIKIMEGSSQPSAKREELLRLEDTQKEKFRNLLENEIIGKTDITPESYGNKLSKSFEDIIEPYKTTQEELSNRYSKFYDSDKTLNQNFFKNAKDTIIKRWEESKGGVKLDKTLYNKAHNLMESLDNAINEYVESNEKIPSKVFESYRKEFNSVARDLYKKNEITEANAVKDLMNEYSDYLGEIIEKIDDPELSSLQNEITNLRKDYKQFKEKYSTKDKKNEEGAKAIEDLINKSVSAEPPLPEELTQEIIGSVDTTSIKNGAFYKAKKLIELEPATKDALKEEVYRKFVFPLTREKLNKSALNSFDKRLESALTKHKSLMNTLYSKEEIKAMEEISKLGEVLFNKPRTAADSGTPDGLIDGIIGMIGQNTSLGWMLRPFIRSLNGREGSEKVTEAIKNRVLGRETYKDIASEKLKKGINRAAIRKISNEREDEEKRRPEITTKKERYKELRNNNSYEKILKNMED